MVARGTLQSLPSVGAEEVSLGLQLGDQPPDVLLVIGTDGIKMTEVHLLVLEFPDGLSVLDQCSVIHMVPSCRSSVFLCLQYTEGAPHFP